MCLCQIIIVVTSCLSFSAECLSLHLSDWWWFTCDQRGHYILSGTWTCDVTASERTVRFLPTSALSLKCCLNKINLVILIFISSTFCTVARFSIILYSDVIQSDKYLFHLVGSCTCGKKRSGRLGTKTSQVVLVAAWWASFGICWLLFPDRSEGLYYVRNTWREQPWESAAVTEGLMGMLLCLMKAENKSRRVTLWIGF